jgi:hypothetical protein
MAFNAGRWAPLLNEASAPALQAPATAVPLAGTRSLDLFGTGGYQDFQNFIKLFPDKDERETALNFLTFKTLMGPTMMQFDEGYQDRMLKKQEELATKRGWKSLMFNQLGSGLDNLTKGIAMSMNPYGTPEAARYAADMLAGSGDRMAAAYAAARTPMAIPAVQGAQAPTYF